MTVTSMTVHIILHIGSHTKPYLFPFQMQMSVAKPSADVGFSIVKHPNQVRLLKIIMIFLFENDKSN